MKGEKLQKVQYGPLTIKHKRVSALYDVIHKYLHKHTHKYTYPYMKIHITRLHASVVLSNVHLLYISKFSDPSPPLNKQPGKKLKDIGEMVTPQP